MGLIHARRCHTRSLRDRRENLIQSYTVDSLNQLSSVSRSGTVTVAGNTRTNATSVTVDQNNNGPVAATLYSDGYDGMLRIQERDGNNVPLVTYTRGKDLSGSRQGAGGIGVLARTDNALFTIGYPSVHAFLSFGRE